MFSCQSLHCNNECTAPNHAEIPRIRWASGLDYTRTSIFFFFFFFFNSVILCWSSTFASTTNQIGGNDSFEIEEGKLIWVHHLVDKLAASIGYISQVEKNAHVKRIDDLRSKLWTAVLWSTKSTPPLSRLYILKILVLNFWC